MSICILEQIKRHLHAIPALPGSGQYRYRLTAAEKISVSSFQAVIIRELNGHKNCLKTLLTRYIPTKDQQTLGRTIDILDRYTTGQVHIDFSRWEEDKKYLLDSIALAQDHQGIIPQLAANAWFYKLLVSTVIVGSFGVMATQATVWMQQPPKKKAADQLQGIVKVNGKLRSGLKLTIDEQTTTTSNQYGEFQAGVQQHRQLHHLQLSDGKRDTILILHHDQLQSPIIIQWNPRTDGQSGPGVTEKLNATRLASLH